MKKVTVITIVILALLMSMLPMSTAFAAKPTPTTDVTFHNRTHGTIALQLIDPNGFHYFYSFANSGLNEYTVSVPEGKYYSYYLVTKCTTEVGTWNLTRNRFVEVYCPTEGVDAQFHAPDHRDVIAQ
jgi:hypothetical protein